jgi:hypothetical protein
MAFYPEPLFPQITHQEKRAFLAAFAHSGRIRRACQSAQISWKSHYLWLKEDAVYAEAFLDAQRMAADFLEDEAIRRAVEGWEEPVFYRGEHVDNVTRFSDTLLIVALKGAKPEKYRENVKVEADLTLRLEASLQQGVKRLESLRGGNRLSA